MKKQDPDFDISMGSYDGAECSELCGLYLQFSVSEVHKVIPKEDFGLYRDDGVGVTRGGGPTADRKRKDLVRIMQSEGLNITGDCNLDSINFLDVNLSLNPSEHKPYVKPNSSIEYLDTRSNHPPIILKNIPVGVEKRLKDISSSEKCFKENIQVYQDALQRSGHIHKLKYDSKNSYKFIRKLCKELDTFMS